MKKSTKILVLLLVLALIIGGLWYYWERPIQISDLIPAGYTKVQFSIAAPSFGYIEQELDQQTQEKILNLVYSSTVTRHDGYDALPSNCYELRLFSDGFPTLIYVGKDGRMSMAVDWDLDHYKYFEDDGQLYQALSDILGIS